MEERDSNKMGLEAIKVDSIVKLKSCKVGQRVMLLGEREEVYAGNITKNTCGCGYSAEFPVTLVENDDGSIKVIENINLEGKGYNIMTVLNSHHNVKPGDEHYDEFRNIYTEGVLA